MNTKDLTMQENFSEIFNLTANETQCYFYLLKHKGVPASIVGKRLNLKRSTAKYTLNQLTKNGFATVIEKNGSHIFYPVSTQDLFQILKEEEKTLQKKREKYSRIQQSMEEIEQAHTNNASVQLFEGIDGLKKSYEKILSLNSTIYSIEDNGEMTELLPEYVKEFVSKRIDNKIHNDTICSEKNSLNIPSQKDLRTVSHLPHFDFGMDIKISKDFVSIISFEKSNPVGVLIQNPSIAKNFMQLFKYLKSTRLEKNI